MSELVERVEAILTRNSVHGSEGRARAAIAEVLDYLAEPSEAVTKALQVEPELGLLWKSRVWTAMLAEMRKEALDQ